MDSSTDNRLNRTPTRDGEVNTYVFWTQPQSMHRLSVPSGKPNWFNTSRRVVFINGMLNSGIDHARSAMMLSEMQQCPVIGVHNMSEGFIKDLGQCIADKLQFHGKASLIRMDTSIEALTSRFESYYKAAKARTPQLTRALAMEQLLASNPAAVSVLRLLTGAERRWPMFAHSQGNLVLSNALTASAILKGEKLLSGLPVHSYGSPALNWPDGIVQQEYGFSFDPVTWFSASFNFKISKVGVPKTGYQAFLTQPISHSFDAYLKSDPEFVINRFRWGG